MYSISCQQWFWVKYCDGNSSVFKILAEMVVFSILSEMAVCSISWRKRWCIHYLDTIGWLWVLTINVPLTLKVQDIIFFLRAKHIMGHFSGFFKGAETFLTPKLSWATRRAILGSKGSRPPQKTPRNVPLYVLPQTKNIISMTFKIRGTLVFLCPNERKER